MRSTYKPLGEFLVEQGVITREQLEEALAQQRKYYLPPRPADIGEGISSEEAQVIALSRMTGVPIWRPETDKPQMQAVNMLPSNLARTEAVLPIKVENGCLVLAMADPGDVQTIDRVSKLTRTRVKAVVGIKSVILRTLDEFFPPLNVTAQVSKLATEATNNTDFGDEEVDPTLGGTQAGTAPVVAIVNQILSEAMRVRTSDIHVEPYQDRIEVRFRIDGQLQRAYELPIKLLPGLAARIKIMAEMDVVEHRLPQDGHLTYKYENRSIDVRVSVLPTHFGSRVVMRVLDKSMTLRSLTELGFADRNLELFRDMISKPWGLVIVTGPTGSGKTTSLYAAVNQLKETSKNILTCEDPVEYEIAGISQSQVNEKIGLTLASLLRSLMRQDPDIILVGEIRDRDTAETAIRAALTGHLVLSTMHSNDALSAVPRLIDMGIEPLLLSSSLIGVTAQRLVRMLCTSCREQTETTPDENMIFKTVYEDGLPKTWQSVGCPKCEGTGYKGRTGIHEVLPITPEMQRLIAMGAPPDELKMVASVYGFRPMQADACDRVAAGMTTLKEVQRTIYFDTMASKARQKAAQASTDSSHLRLANS